MVFQENETKHSVANCSSLASQELNRLVLEELVVSIPREVRECSWRGWRGFVQPVLPVLLLLLSDWTQSQSLSLLL